MGSLVTVVSSGLAVARMENSRMPRDIFPQRYSANGLRNRWKDGVVKDLRSCDLLASWYDVVCETGSAWCNTYSSVA